MSLSDYLPATRRYVKELVMATVQELEQAIADEREEVNRKVDDLAAEIEALKQQVGTGTVLQPADFDKLIERVRGIYVAPTPPIDAPQP